MNRLFLFKRKKKKKLNILPPSTPQSRRRRSSSYTVAPHLQAEFDVPLSAFAAAHAEYTDFVVAGFIFSERSSVPPAAPAAAVSTAPRMLLLQRAWSDSYGGYWDFPGGSVEPSSDATLLDGVAREVREETGFHVSRIRELVRVDAWVAHMGRRKVAKYSFIVDVHEAAESSAASGEWEDEDDESESDHNSVVTQQQQQQQHMPLNWEDQVQLAEAEHQRYVWATEEEVEASVVNKRNGRGEEGPYLFVGIQGETALEAFRKYKSLKGD